MGRLGLEGCDILHDIQRLQRKRAHCWNKESEFDNSDTWRFKKQLRKTKNIDEDYAQYLMLLFDFNKDSTNEGGSGIVKDRFNHDVNEYEDEDEDEDDPDYKKFLANAKPKGNSYVLKIDRSDGFPVSVEYEKEDGSDEEYEYLGRGKQQDAGDEKDLDKVESQPFSRTVLENDNDVIVEPPGPVTQKEKGLTSQNLTRRRKGETKSRSNKEQKTGKGRKSAKNITNKEAAADVDEDYALLLEKFIYKNWHLPNSFVRKYNLKRQQSSRTVVENDSDSDPLPPKKKKKRGLTSKKNSMNGNDASKRQGKGEKKKRSSKEQTARKGRKSSAIVDVNEDVAGREPLNVAVKEEIADVDEEASFNATEEDLQIIVSENCTFGKEGSSILMDASSAKHCENVEDSCLLQTVHSEFWWNVKALLERPYDQKEYIGLWKLVKSRKHTLKNMDLRNGKFCSTRRLGKSYLDHYKDLHEKLEEVDSDNRKTLNILRGFFFWLQNLTQKGAFRPWTNPEWLSLVDEYSVNLVNSGQSGERCK